MKTLEKVLKCGNPNCKRMTDQLLRVHVKGWGMCDLCPQCREYALRMGKFRTAEMEKARAAMAKEREEGRTSLCNNPNCRSPYLDRGSFGKHDGKYYCNACFLYSKRHNGENRPKELVEAYEYEQSRKRAKGLQKCENKNCGRRLEHLVRTDLKEKGFFHLCPSCYYYARHNDGAFRTAKMEQARIRKEQREREKNPDRQRKRARKEESSGGGGAGDPIVLTDDDDGSSERWQKCPNPHCGQMVKYLVRTEIEGEGTLHLCNACYCYGRNHHKFRPANIVRVSKDVKLRKQELQRCFNPNCRTTELDKGLYAKHNNQFYCHGCAFYANMHGG